MALISKLQDVIDGKIRRLAIFLPPGYAKSTYSSVLFPPYFLGRFPKKKIIGVSHTQNLADKHGARARNVCYSDRYKRIFGTNVDPRSGQAKSDWGLTNGSSYLGVGVGGGVTGNRGHCGIIDDPLRSWKDADSKTIRDTLHEFYLADFRSRLLPGAPIILINTRWHEDALEGRILGENYKGGSGWFKAVDGEMWFVLSLPAIAEEEDYLGRKPGEVLWPDYYTPKLVYQERRVQTARNWAALWQQRPAPEEGDFFQRPWFCEYDEEPKHIKKYGASDYAVSDGEGDFTEHGVIGVDPKDDIYILDWWYKQAATDEWIEVLIQMMVRHRPITWFEEKIQITKSVGPFIEKKMRESRAFCGRDQIACSADKPTRAQAIRGRMQQRKVYFPSKQSPNWGPWVERLQAQLLTFPTGKNDDGVDVLSLFGLGLMNLMKAAVPKPKAQAPNPLRFDQITQDHVERSPYRLNK